MQARHLGSSQNQIAILMVLICCRPSESQELPSPKPSPLQKPPTAAAPADTKRCPPTKVQPSPFANGAVHQPTVPPKQSAPQCPPTDTAKADGKVPMEPQANSQTQTARDEACAAAVPTTQTKAAGSEGAHLSSEESGPALLEQRTAGLRRASSQLDQAKARIAAASAAVAEKEAQLQRVEAELAEAVARVDLREAELAQVQADAALKDAQLVEMGAQLQLKEESINKVNEMLQQREAEVDEVAGQLEESRSQLEAAMATMRRRKADGPDQQVCQSSICYGNSSRHKLGCP